MERALSSPGFGPYSVQAAISAVHAQAERAGSTDWGEIVGLYDLLHPGRPLAGDQLNRAVAVAMRDGPAAGLALIDAILDRGELQDYRLAHAARADMCRRLGRAPRSAGVLPAGARADKARTGAAIPGAPDRGDVGGHVESINGS